MKIGNWEFENCNECPAYEWAGECMNHGDHGMRCGFGAFSHWYDGKHPIPEDCPIKSSAVVEKVKFVKCNVCGWNHYNFYLKKIDGILCCPDCLCSIDEE